MGSEAWQLGVSRTLRGRDTAPKLQGWMHGAPWIHPPAKPKGNIAV
jgi:hypothetical protein